MARSHKRNTDTDFFQDYAQGQVQGQVQGQTQEQDLFSRVPYENARAGAHINNSQKSNEYNMPAEYKMPTGYADPLEYVVPTEQNGDALNYSNYASYDSYLNYTRRTNISEYPNRKEPGKAHNSKQAQDSKNKPLKIIWVIVVSIIYWPLAIIGVADPFISDFNFGTLQVWQVIFSRAWLAFVMGGIFYIFLVNMFHIRNANAFQKAKTIKIIAILILVVVISFAVIRIVCTL